MPTCADPPKLDLPMHDQVLVSEHFACPFGATSSVHAWERVGCMLRTVARVLLMMPAFFYVDDCFAVDRYIHPQFSHVNLHAFYMFEYY